MPRDDTECLKWFLPKSAFDFVRNEHQIEVEKICLEHRFLLTNSLAYKRIKEIWHDTIAGQIGAVYHGRTYIAEFVQLNLTTPIRNNEMYLSEQDFKKFLNYTKQFNEAFQKLGLYERLQTHSSYNGR